jgi:hypothetical protein
MGEMKIAFKIVIKIFKEKDHFEYIDADVRTILKLILLNLGVKGWTGLHLLRIASKGD